MTADKPDDVTLFFCVGATKAGTSWLHSQLQTHPDCHLRSIKELHYFGLNNDRHFARAIKTAEADTDAARAHAKTVDAARRPYAERRLQDLLDWQTVLRAGSGGRDAYLAYLQHGRATRHLVGDVTPAYSLLDAATLADMARLLPDVRFVYVLRDPVERLWSHVRMVSARADKANFVKGSLTLMQALLSGQDSPEITGILKRGDYSANLARLSGALRPDQLLVTIYEDMFAANGLDPITRFLGIRSFAPQTEARVHAGLPLDLPEDLFTQAKALLRPQYQAVASHLGAVPQAWVGNSA